MTVEIQDLSEERVLHLLSNGEFEIRADLGLAVSARAPIVRWAKPDKEEPLLTP